MFGGYRCLVNPGSLFLFCGNQRKLKASDFQYYRRGEPHLTSPVNTNYTLAMLKGLTRKHLHYSNFLKYVDWEATKGSALPELFKLFGVVDDPQKTVRYACTYGCHGMKHTKCVAICY